MKDAFLNKYTYLMAFIATTPALAFAQTTTTTNTGNAWTRLKDVKAEGDDAINLGIVIAMVIGFFIVLFSLYKIYDKYNNQQSQVKMTGPVIGLVIGGCLMAINSISAQFKDLMDGGNTLSKPTELSGW